jgi:hypothetical protein
MPLPTKKTPIRNALADQTIFLHGPPKYGKSSFCAQAEDALFLATEPGLNSLEVFQVPINNWEEFLAACAEVAEGNHAFGMVVVDTIDNAYRMCVEHVCRKKRVEHESELKYGLGYALVGSEFTRVLVKLAQLKVGLVLIGHSQEKEVETRTGKTTKIIPTLPERARKTVLALADLILYCDLEATVGPDGKAGVRRVLRTKPSAHYEAGDRTGRLPEVIELDYQKFVRAFHQGRLPDGPSGAGVAPTHVPPAATTALGSTAAPQEQGKPRGQVAAR